LLEQIACTIARYRMFDGGQKVGIAVSGGADSVCLLYALRELAPRWDLRFRVLHLNHGLRGAESDGDAEFVRGLAAEFGFPFDLREANLLQVDGNLEQAARDARLAFFQDEIAGGRVDRVATGHTRSDQAETVLFRFLRGAGTAGMAGIRPVTSTGLVRPLIAIDRSDVEKFLTDRGIRWREDASNGDIRFARNRIRHELLPGLARDWNPSIVPALAQTADWALAEESYWKDQIDRLSGLNLKEKNRFVLLETGCLKDLPLAVARRLVRRAMEIAKGDPLAIEFAHVNAVLELAATNEGHGRLQTPGLDIMRSFNWFRFAKPAPEGSGRGDYEFPVPIPGYLPVPGEEFAISLEVVENLAASRMYHSVYNSEMVPVDSDQLAGALTLRNWRPGDQYQRSGDSGEQKIKTLFQEFRVPLWERRHWPVLTDQRSIVWARRFGPSVHVAAGSGTKRILKIEEIGIARERDGV
jgi:tRNA(Ile)-lysidine synthase